MRCARGINLNNSERLDKEKAPWVWSFNSWFKIKVVYVGKTYWSNVTKKLIMNTVHSINVQFLITDCCSHALKYRFCNGFRFVRTFEQNCIQFVQIVHVVVVR